MRDQRKLKNSTLRAINIRQLKPNDSGDSVFHIFERLNTGGTRLKPQEIRNAVYRGEVVTNLKKLNLDENWQKILGLKRPDKSQKDVELVLRLFSLFEDWENYEKPMLTHLNRFMKKNSAFDSDAAKRFSIRFKETVELVASAFQSPFRPRGVINSAVLEAVMVVLLEHPEIQKSELIGRYQNLINNGEFLNLITGGTTDTATLHNRIKLANRILTNAP